ncbi:hypothetical protein Vlu01_19260 [Micromonospora lutea]|uniref:Uncharacterized protein n=1 Tax=Micromonospora lutea TaxID=419825 RepID=A0ABQ4ITV8_9ACTN|nr:hypothetical protein Vlu01_19260 [Micromonospora lutea]
MIVASTRLDVARPVGTRVGFTLAPPLGLGSRIPVATAVRVTSFRFPPGVPLRVASRVPVGFALVTGAVRVAAVRVTLIAAVDVPVRVALVAVCWRAWSGGLWSEFRPDDPVATPGGLAVRRASSLGPRLLRSGTGRHRPVVRPRAVRAVDGSPVGDLVPARPAIRLVVPGPTGVRAVGPGWRERRHLGTADGAGAASCRRRLVLGPDITGITLARELRLPLARRLDDPARLGGIVPPVGVTATHPPDLSLGPGRRREVARAATRGA